MRTPSFYRPYALLVKAALISDSRHCFDDIVVENDRGTVVLSGALPESRLAREAVSLAAQASGVFVVDHILVPAA
jgi:osmotically-inducible protein OsmY